MSAADRLRSRARHAAEVTGILRIRRQRARVEELATAVRENEILGAGLDDLVGQLEQQLVPLLERRQQGPERPQA